MSSWQIFLNTVAIVMGLLLPVFLLVWFYMIKIMWQAVRERKQHEYEIERMRSPYDKVVLKEVPNPKMLEIEMYKDGEVVWKEATDKP